MSRIIRPGFGDVTAPSICNNRATPGRHFVDGHEQFDSPLDHDSRRENDTEFGEALLQPESKVPKTYYVKVSGVLTLEEYFQLAGGLDIGRGERSGPCIVHEVRAIDKYTWFELTITEGKNRQVRRMCDAIGHPVLKLVRIRVGRLQLDDLPIGKFRILSNKEAQTARSL